MSAEPIGRGANSRVQRVPFTERERHWRERAACKGADTSLFFAAEQERGSTKRAKQERARKFCDICPVTAECLRWALDNEERSGIWGGKTPDERRAIAKAERSRRRPATIG